MLQNVRTSDNALLSRIVHGKVDGRLTPTDEELLGMCHLLLLAGLDTVTATLDCMIAWLAQHPERRRQLVEHPELIDNGGGAASPRDAGNDGRACRLAKDFEFPAVARCARATSLTPLIGAANLDEGEFDDPL